MARYAPLFLLFFLSGISGLIYQVVWVRAFGHAFGNTIYSASLVIAIFMLGLGAGGYLLGAWADRRYTHASTTLLRAYAVVELAIAALGLLITLLLPRLGGLTASLSSYTTTPEGWYALSQFSYLARAAIAIVLLTPVTVLMGGTLTLLIRHRVHADVEATGRRVAVLYGINTAGAALGAFLTDFAMIPAIGLFATQLVAVALNVVAGVGAWGLARRPRLARLAPQETEVRRP
jgi:spermidine synthase